MELVTGATGYIGGRLLRRLAGEGRARARAARAGRTQVEPLAGVEAAEGDLLSGAGLDGALDGCHTRLLPRALDGGARERRRVRRPRPPRRRGLRRGRPREAGVKRIVYLGGIEPEGGAAVAPPALAPRGRAHPARRRSGLDRAARLDRDRRRVVVLSSPGAAGRAVCACCRCRPGRATAPSRSPSAT